MEDRSRRGDWHLICDRCAGEMWASESVKEWTGLRVHRFGCADRRHPQEFVRGRADRQKVPFARPDPAPVFVDIGTISLSASTVSEAASPGTVIGALTVSGIANSVFTLVDSAGGRFAIVGSNLVVGPAGLDYEAATSHQISISALYAVPGIFTVSVTDDPEMGVGSPIGLLLALTKAA